MSTIEFRVLRELEDQEERFQTIARKYAETFDDANKDAALSAALLYRAALLRQVTQLKHGATLLRTAGVDMPTGERFVSTENEMNIALDVLEKALPELSETSAVRLSKATATVAENTPLLIACIDEVGQELRPLVKDMLEQ